MSSSPVVFSKFNACWHVQEKRGRCKPKSDSSDLRLIVAAGFSWVTLALCGVILLSSVYRRLEFCKLLTCHGLAGILIAGP